MQIWEATGIYQHCFHLSAGQTSYVMAVTQEGYLVHLYYGAALEEQDALSLFSQENAAWYPPNENEPLLDKLMLEYPVSGMADLRPAALSLFWDDGDTTADLRYAGHRVLQGKPAIPGLPAVYTQSEEEGETLIITLYDAAKQLTCNLFYSVLFAHNAILRHASIQNEGTHTATLTRAMSASLDFASVSNEKKALLHLHGTWIAECNPQLVPIQHCSYAISSEKGASGHGHNPFAAIVSEHCTEEAGEAYGISLVYSGNFKIEADTDEKEALRISAGINDKAFLWQLAPSETFHTPETVLMYSNQGIGSMARSYHALYQTRLARGVWAEKSRPVLLNTWEGAYFNFNHDSLLGMAKEAAALGVELFVLDDGWFGKRNAPDSSLGDWVANEEKLGCTLEKLANDINAEGLSFGLWVEPEMVSPDSNLYRAHPDWALQIKGRKATKARAQLVLDLSRAEVQEHLIKEMTTLFQSANIAYVKWDMNRTMSEIASPGKSSTGAIAHQYMLGLYYILETLTKRFPDILFESCASGGGRFDAGMLFYMPQGWLSDNTDAACRLTIQYGASTVYPPASMGAHVSVVPNHQVWRTTPLQTRFHTALFGGSFGYELDVTQLTTAEKEAIQQQIVQYKATRDMRRTAKLYRLGNPVCDNDTGWMFVNENGAELTVVRKTSHTQSEAVICMRLAGLVQDAVYEIEDETGVSYASGKSGRFLMQNGLNLTMPLGDFSSVHFFLKQK